jgi:hypothetical protein
MFVISYLYFILFFFTLVATHRHEPSEKYNKYEQMYAFHGPERIKRVEKKIDKNLKPYIRKNGSLLKKMYESNCICHV